MQIRRADTSGVFNAFPWLACCAPNQAARFVDACALVSLEPGETLYHSGAPPAHFFVLLDGRLGAWRSTRDDAYGMLYFIADQPMTVLCVENVITDIVYFATMRALDPGADVVRVPKTALDELLADHPRVGLDIAVHIARRLQAFTEQATDLGLLDVPRRLAKYLALMVDPTTMTIDLQMHQADLARRLAASRQSVNQVLTQFLHRGWITPLGPGRYHVTDLDALTALAGNPHYDGAERLH